MRSSGEAGITVERITEEATRLFVEQGYRGISMREIAHAVAVTKPVLYYYFKDKEDLFVAILIANLERLGTLVQSARRDGTSTRDRVRLTLTAIFGQAPSQRAIIRLASQEVGHLSEEARTRFDHIYHDRFVGQVEAILCEGVERGELGVIDPRTATWLLLGMAQPFLAPGREQGVQKPAQMVDLLVSVFFDGIAAPEATASNQKS